MSQNPFGLSEAFDLDQQSKSPYATIPFLLHAEERYAEVAARNQDPVKAQQYHNVLGRIFRPHVYFQRGVESDIEFALANDYSLAVGSDHTSNNDPLDIASAANNNEVLRPMLGRTMIDAKLPIFRNPLFREVVPDLGAQPLPRGKDVRKLDISKEDKAIMFERLKICGDLLIATQTAGLNDGKHLFKFPGGGRNQYPRRRFWDHEPHKVGEIKEGYARAVSGVKQDRGVYMVAAAIFHGRGRNATFLEPTFVFTRIDDQSRDDPEKITSNMREAMVDASLRAQWIHNGDLLPDQLPTEAILAA